MASEQGNSDDVYALIANIPSFYHSSDLRNYFSQFIESGGFECFHFRHRPEKTSESNAPAPSENSSSSKCKTMCCIVRLRRTQLEKLQKMYNRRHWLDKKGDPVAALCFISKIKVTPQTADKDAHQPFRSRGELKKIPPDREAFTYSDLIRLSEMNPPGMMPNGNVGTPTRVFMELIQQCQLPPKIISKLGLVFPKLHSKRRYGNVEFDYGLELHEGTSEEFGEVLSAKGHDILREGTTTTKPKKVENNGAPRIQGEGKGEESEEDADDCEEWERHEAFHDDPSNQERNKERLYEEEMEIVWEKGGPGIVWYTDAQFWDQQEGDEEEKDVDDWDIDMSEYYEPGSGDKDARDFIQMRKHVRMTEGIGSDDEDVLQTKIGKFERHTKGIGRKLMEKQGWTDGQGLGSTVLGMADALDNDGQKPKDKRGFGYRGEKLVHGLSGFQPKRKKADDNVYRVWSVYDRPAKQEAEETLLRRPEPYGLKCRDGIRFVKAVYTPTKDTTSSS